MRDERFIFFFFFSSRRRHTRWNCDWSSDVCSSDLFLLVRTGVPRPKLCSRQKIGPADAGDQERDLRDPQPSSGGSSSVKTWSKSPSCGLRAAANFPKPFNVICPVQSPCGKYSSCPVGQIRTISLAVSSQREGRWPSSRTLGRDAVDAVASC